MFKSLRITYWLVAGFLKKHALIILLSLPLGFIAYFTWLKFAPLMPHPKPYHRIGKAGWYSLASLPIDIQGQISSGLTNLTPEGTATPSLALNWDQSPDGKSYAFHLDRGLRWHNREPVRASHIKYSIADVSLSYPDDHTVQFDLKEAFAPFPTIVRPFFK